MENNSQIDLFHMDFNEALTADVLACGGNKTIGQMLWPEMDPQDAGKKLSRCMSDHSKEFLKIDQIILIQRMAREHGSVASLTYQARECGCTEPQPIRVEDEKAMLQQEYIQAVKGLGTIAKRLEKIG